MRRISSFSDIWAFSISSSSWTRLPITSVPFSAGGTLTLIGRYLYLYGGQSQFTNGTLFTIGTITRIDVDLMTSYTYKPPFIPEARHSHSAVSYADRLYVLY